MRAAPGVGRHRPLLSHPLVGPWHESRALRSRLSADQYLRQFGLLLERTGLDPERIISLARESPDKLRDILVRDAARLKREGRLDSYVSKFLEGLKAFLKFHRVSFDGYPSLSPIKGASLSREWIPRPEELGRVLERLSLRGRVIALFHAHSGLRPGVLGSYGGETGLTLDNLPELKLGSEPEFSEVPFVIRVPAHLSKTRVSYVTFGTQQLATALLAYLKSRKDRGEVLKPSSPVIATAETRGIATRAHKEARFGRGFLCTKVVEDELRTVLHATVPEGVTWRPYVLRSYCSTRLLLAEGQGRISRDLREAILGHDGGVASRYNVGKRWGEELLAEARREYANAAEFLETNAQSRVNVAAEFRRTLLAVAGLSEDEAAKHVNDSNDELLAILRQKLTGREASALPPTNGNGNGHGVQKPVTLEEAETLLAQGWTYVANFGPNRVILQAP